MSTVFISYRHVDFPRAKSLADLLSAAGFTVEMSDPQTPFASPIDEIAKYIHKANAIVSIPSEEESQWVEAEKKFAKSNSLPFFESVGTENVPELIHQLKHAKRRERGFFDLDNRFEIFVQDFRAINPKETFSNIYDRAAEEEHTHAGFFWISFISTFLFISFGAITYLVHRRNLRLFVLFFGGYILLSLLSYLCIWLFRKLFKGSVGIQENP